MPEDNDDIKTAMSDILDKSDALKDDMALARAQLRVLERQFARLARRDPAAAKALSAERGEPEETEEPEAKKTPTKKPNA